MSKLEEIVKNLIEEAFPTYNCYKEYYVKYERKKLFFDFHLPELKLVIEVQGSQHYKFSRFYHGTVDNLKRQLIRDDLKVAWSIDNKYTLITLNEKDIKKLTADKFKKLIISKL